MQRNGRVLVALAASSFGAIAFVGAPHYENILGEGNTVGPIYVPSLLFFDARTVAKPDSVEVSWHGSLAKVGSWTGAGFRQRLGDALILSYWDHSPRPEWKRPGELCRFIEQQRGRQDRVTRYLLPAGDVDQNYGTRCLFVEEETGVQWFYQVHVPPERCDRQGVIAVRVARPTVDATKLSLDEVFGHTAAGLPLAAASSAQLLPSAACARRMERTVTLCIFLSALLLAVASFAFLWLLRHTAALPRRVRESMLPARPRSAKTTRRVLLLEWRDLARQDLMKRPRQQGLEPLACSNLAAILAELAAEPAAESVILSVVHEDVLLPTLSAVRAQDSEVRLVGVVPSVSPVIADAAQVFGAAVIPHCAEANAVVQALIRHDTVEAPI